MRLALLALVLAGCAHVGRPPPRPWVVEGGIHAEQVQALAIAAAAARVFPDGSVQNGGTIHLADDIDVGCGYKFPEAPGILHYAGCLNSGVWVLWPHPKLPLGADLTSSALPHELGHLALPLCTEAQAEAAGLLIVKEYRKGVP